MEVTWKHGSGSGSRSGSGLQIFLQAEAEAEAEAKVHRFHITGCDSCYPIARLQPNF